MKYGNFSEHSDEFFLSLAKKKVLLLVCEFAELS